MHSWILCSNNFNGALKVVYEVKIVDGALYCLNNVDKSKTSKVHSDGELLILESEHTGASRPLWALREVSVKSLKQL